MNENNSDYSGLVLDLIKNPLNKGKLSDADIEVNAGNPYCGDEITVYIKLKNDLMTINDARYESKGCAISNASASLLSEKIKGKKITDLLEWNQNNMFGLFESKLMSRVKCVTLSLTAIQAGISKFLKTKKNVKARITV